MILNSSKSLNESSDPHSKLLGMIRKEVIEKSLLDLPKKEEVDILQMLIQMIEVKDKNSINDAECAYFAFKWIEKNIEFDFKGKDDPSEIYNSGIGSSLGLTSLFNRICSFLKVESDSISGYIKFHNVTNIEFIEKMDFSWNYIVIDKENYLLDVSFTSFLYKNLKTNFPNEDAYFGMNPENFINYHFPKESKFKFLSEPYTIEKFDSMAYRVFFFSGLGFKTISPNSKEISIGSKIILTFDETIDFDVTSEILTYESHIINHECIISKGKVEIELNLKDEKLFVIGIGVKIKNMEDTFPIAFYKFNNQKKKKNFLDSKKMIQSQLDMKKPNYFLSKTFNKVKKLNKDLLG